MDDNELHYLTYEEGEIWDDMVMAYIQAGGDILYPGDEKEMLLRGVEQIIMQCFAGIDNALRMNTLRYAVRDYLDIYGEKRNCYRIQASAAKAAVTIVTNATGEAIKLPAGTAMTQDGSLFWTLDEDIWLTGGVETFTVGITASTPGIAGNGLTTGMEMGMVIQNPAINSVTVATDATGGQSAEDDETYRERIRVYGLNAITTGPAEQYKRVAMAVSSQIIDAVALNGGDGVVDVYLLPASNDGIAALIAAVEAALSAEDTRPLTDDVNVSLATKKEYDLKINYAVYSGQNVSAAISAAVNEYKDWQNKTIGRAFNPDRLKALLYQAGCNYVEIDATSSFDGGTAEYTEIDPNEYCAGTITLAVIST